MIFSIREWVGSTEGSVVTRVLGLGLKSVGATALALASAATLISTDASMAGASMQSHSLGAKGRVVQLAGAVVSKVLPLNHRIDVVRKGTSVTYVIQYSATTVFYGSRPKSIVKGTTITVAGILKGKTIMAQKISTRRWSAPTTSGIGTPDFAANGPYVGIHYVGNV